MTDYGAVAFTDGLKAVADANVMRRALAYARTFDLVIAQQPQEPALAQGVMNEGELATRLGLPGIPAAAEVMMVERDLRLVELTGGRYHAANISTAAAIPCIADAKARGLKVTCDTAPHYFTLNENAVGDYRTFAKVSPPLRSEDDRRAVADGPRRRHHRLHRQRPQPARPGLQAPALLQLADFGIVGLESLLPLSLELVHKERDGPARAARLPDVRGRPRSAACRPGIWPRARPPTW